MFGGGGWVAMPLAVLFGLFVAVALREADAILRDEPLRLVAPLWRAGLVGVRRPVSLMRWRAAAVAEHLMGRGAPIVVV